MLDIWKNMVWNSSDGWRVMRLEGVWRFQSVVSSSICLGIVKLAHDARPCARVNKMRSNRIKLNEKGWNVKNSSSLPTNTLRNHRSFSLDHMYGVYSTTDRYYLSSVISCNARYDQNREQQTRFMVLIHVWSGSTKPFRIPQSYAGTTLVVQHQDISGEWDIFLLLLRVDSSE